MLLLLLFFFFFSFKNNFIGEAEPILVDGFVE